MVVCGNGYWYEAFWGSSVWIVSFDNIVIMLAAFVVCRVIPATQGTFRWRVPSLIAIFAVMCATAFDTRVGFVAVRSCVRTVDIVRIVEYVSCSFEEVLCG